NPSFPDGHVARRPILYLDLVNGNERSSCYAIVDSGADHCAFPLSLALRLGLDPAKGVPTNTTGVGVGAVPTFYWPVKIDFPGIATLDVYAGFTDGLENIGFGLLGQA